MVVLTALGMLLRFMIGAIFALIFWGGLLLLAFSVVWGVISSMFGWNQQAPARIPTIAYPTRIAVPTPFGPSAVEHGHRRPVVPPPPPMPEMAVPCGISHGTTIELVRCVSPRANLIGFAKRTEPQGHLTDCVGRTDAYSTGSDWWVCWLSLGTPVDRHASSPNPFKTPNIGGVLDGDR